MQFTLLFLTIFKGRNTIFGPTIILVDAQLPMVIFPLLLHAFNRLTKYTCINCVSSKHEYDKGKVSPKCNLILLKTFNFLWNVYLGTTLWSYPFIHDIGPVNTRGRWEMMQIDYTCSFTYYFYKPYKTKWIVPRNIPTWYITMYKNVFSQHLISDIGDLNECSSHVNV